MADSRFTSEALAIKKRLRSRYESHHLSISDGALTAAAVDLVILYLPGRYLPDKGHRPAGRGLRPGAAGGPDPAPGAKFLEEWAAQRQSGSNWSRVTCAASPAACWMRRVSV